MDFNKIVIKMTQLIFCIAGVAFLGIGIFKYDSIGIMLSITHIFVGVGASITGLKLVVFAYQVGFIEQ